MPSFLQRLSSPFSGCTACCTVSDAEADEDPESELPRQGSGAVQFSRAVSRTSIDSQQTLFDIAYSPFSGGTSLNMEYEEQNASQKQSHTVSHSSPKGSIALAGSPGESPYVYRQHQSPFKRAASFFSPRKSHKAPADNDTEADRVGVGYSANSRISPMFGLSIEQIARDFPIGNTPVGQTETSTSPTFSASKTNTSMPSPSVVNPLSILNSLASEQEDDNIRQKLEYLDLSTGSKELGNASSYPTRSAAADQAEVAKWQARLEQLQRSVSSLSPNTESDTMSTEAARSPNRQGLQQSPDTRSNTLDSTPEQGEQLSFSLKHESSISEFLLSKPSAKQGRKSGYPHHNENRAPPKEEAASDLEERLQVEHEWVSAYATLVGDGDRLTGLRTEQRVLQLARQVQDQSTLSWRDGPLDLKPENRGKHALESKSAAAEARRASRKADQERLQADKQESEMERLERLYLDMKAELLQRAAAPAPPSAPRPGPMDMKAELLQRAAAPAPPSAPRPGPNAGPRHPPLQPPQPQPQQRARAAGASRPAGGKGAGPRAGAGARAGGPRHAPAAGPREDRTRESMAGVKAKVDTGRHGRRSEGAGATRAPAPAGKPGAREAEAGPRAGKSPLGSRQVKDTGKGGRLRASPSAARGPAPQGHAGIRSSRQPDSRLKNGRGADSQATPSRAAAGPASLAATAGIAKSGEERGGRSNTPKYGPSRGGDPPAALAVTPNRRSQATRAGEGLGEGGAGVSKERGADMERASGSRRVAGGRGGERRSGAGRPLGAPGEGPRLVIGRAGTPTGIGRGREVLSEDDEGWAPRASRERQRAAGTPGARRSVGNPGGSPQMGGVEVLLKEEASRRSVSAPRAAVSKSPVEGPGLELRTPGRTAGGRSSGKAVKEVKISLGDLFSGGGGMGGREEGPSGRGPSGAREGQAQRSSRVRASTGGSGGGGSALEGPAGGHSPAAPEAAAHRAAPGPRHGTLARSLPHFGAHAGAGSPPAEEPEDEAPPAPILHIDAGSPLHQASTRSCSSLESSLVGMAVAHARCESGSEGEEEDEEEVGVPVVHVDVMELSHEQSKLEVTNSSIDTSIVGGAAGAGAGALAASEDNRKGPPWEVLAQQPAYRDGDEPGLRPRHAPAWGSVGASDSDSDSDEGTAEAMERGRTGAIMEGDGWYQSGLMPPEDDDEVVDVGTMAPLDMQGDSEEEDGRGMWSSEDEALPPVPGPRSRPGARAAPLRAAAAPHPPAPGSSSEGLPARPRLTIQTEDLTASNGSSTPGEAGGAWGWGARSAVRWAQVPTVSDNTLFREEGRGGTPPSSAGPRSVRKGALRPLRLRGALQDLVQLLDHIDDPPAPPHPHAAPPAALPHRTHAPGPAHAAARDVHEKDGRWGRRMDGEAKRGPTGGEGRREDGNGTDGRWKLTPSHLNFADNERELQLFEAIEAVINSEDPGESF